MLLTFVPAVPALSARSAFAPRAASARALRRARVPLHCSAATPPSRDDDKEGETNVDWNESWVRFRSSGMSSDAPPGRSAVTPQQLAAKRAATKARNAIEDVRNNVPSRQELFRDWRFWVAIIFALSLFSAFINSTQAPSATGII